MFETSLDYYAILKEVRILAQSAGVTVQFTDDQTVVPHATSTGHIVVNTPDPRWDHEQLLHWKHIVYHEIGHLHPEMLDGYQVLVDHNIDMNKESVLSLGLNCLEDYRQEKHDLGKFAGRDRVLSKGNAIAIDKLAKKFDAHPDFEKVSDTFKMVDALQGAVTRFRSEWQRDLIGIDERYTKHFTPQMREWYDKLLSYRDDLNAVKTAEEEYQLLKRIIEEVFELDAEEEEQKSQGKPDAGDGEEDSGDSNGEGKGKARRSDSSRSSGDKEGDKADAAGKVTYDDLMLHKHEESEHTGASFAPLEINYDGWVEGRYARFSPDYNPTVYDFVNGSGTSNHSTEYVEEVQGMHVSRGMANQIRKLLQVKSQSVKIYGQKQGRIANKSIHRVTMKGTGEYQRKVFRKTIENNILDTAVTILADFSGSMGGEKQEHSMASCLLLNDTLAKIGIPVEILGFTESWSDKSQMYVFKTHKKPVSRDKLLESMGRASAHNMGGNADGEAVLWAYDRLRRQENKRKILIVLSDGEPACGRSGDIYGFTKEVVKKIETDKQAEIYGIGIMSRTVRNIYSHHQVINSADELETALLSVIKNYILN